MTKGKCQKLEILCVLCVASLCTWWLKNNNEYQSFEQTKYPLMLDSETSSE
jgi:hypothetical protein